MTTRTLAPQNISLIVVDDSAVSVAAPGQLKIDLSGLGKQSLALGDGKLSFSATTGALTSTKGLTISTGGLTVTAGGLTVSAGTVSIALSNYADDAAAAAGGVPVGGWYRTSGAPKIRLV